MRRQSGTCVTVTPYLEIFSLLSIGEFYGELKRNKKSHEPSSPCILETVIFVIATSVIFSPSGDLEQRKGKRGWNLASPGWKEEKSCLHFVFFSSPEQVLPNRL